MNAHPTDISVLIGTNAEMRVGRKLKRTLYLTTGQGPDRDLCVGIVDSEELAAEIVHRWNRLRHPNPLPPDHIVRYEKN